MPRLRPYRPVVAGNPGSVDLYQPLGLQDVSQDVLAPILQRLAQREQEVHPCILVQRLFSQAALDVGHFVFGEPEGFQVGQRPVHLAEIGPLLDGLSVGRYTLFLAAQGFQEVPHADPGWSPQNRAR